MTISYDWLMKYLPAGKAGQPFLDPDRLSRILTSIGLEVESMRKYEEIKGGLKGLVIGEVVSAEKHPNADKLTLTKVEIGNGEPLQIVCGAPNVAAGQKVVVAPVGTTIYPTNGEPLTMKVAKIRSVESYGMICAEDEIGLGLSHAGIIVLPENAKVGARLVSYIEPYEDIIYEIGLTPNRMDAMSHWGVARDVCAYLSYHDKKPIKPVYPEADALKTENNSLVISVKVENHTACPRYSGISISNLKIAPSPKWLQQKLTAIGIRPINNVVDITNYVQHEMGQPLHAFDADQIAGKKIIVKNVAESTAFVTLDEKERKLSAEDLLICDESGPICIAGVFGGLHSGVTEKTTNIFLESACFDPVTTRKTSFRHGLRTDAASRFEKGTDISGTVQALKRAVKLINEICGGQIASPVIDIYPDPKPKSEVSVKWHFIKKLGGKNYHPDAIKDILGSLGFEIIKEGIDELRVAVPYHKTDISLPADLVEEIIRIDGLDNIEIPEAITITPSLDENYSAELYKEKLSGWLAGQGFSETMTNSITNAEYFSSEEQQTMVRLLNSLSTELNILRNSLFETAMEVVAHNLNHKNSSLRLFEYGKTYALKGLSSFSESEQLCLVITGNINEQSWKQKAVPADIFYTKGIVLAILDMMGLKPDSIEVMEVPKLQKHFVVRINNEIVAGVGESKKNILDKFGIRQPVFFAGLNWQLLCQLAIARKKNINELPKYPAVQRDLAMIVSNNTSWEQIRLSVDKIKPPSLREIKLFDIFESESFGKDRKSVAVNFVFRNDERTLTDKDIDDWMQQIIVALEKNVQAEIRK